MSALSSTASFPNTAVAHFPTASAFPLSQQQQQHAPPLRQRSVSSNSSSSLSSNGLLFPSSNNNNNNNGGGDETVDSPPSTPCRIVNAAQGIAALPHSNATPRAYNGKRRLPTPAPSSSSSSNSSNSNNNGNAANHLTNPGTQQRLMAFEEEHHHVDENVPANGMSSSSSSSFDCLTLQHSLKRVRLSSSPGELRLSSDLNELVTGNGLRTKTLASTTKTTVEEEEAPWEQNKEDEWECPARQWRLERCPVDPLRLFFFCPASGQVNHNYLYNNNNHHFNHNHNINSNNNADGVVCLSLQFPRIYPHKPPKATRQESFGGGYFSTCEPENGVSDEDEGMLSTTVFNGGWSPILRLSDVLEHLQEKVAKASLAQHGFCQHHHGNDENVHHPHTHSMMLQEEEEDELSANTPTTSHVSGEEEDMMMMMMTTTTTSTSTPIASAFLSPNRFDIGYQRPNDYDEILGVGGGMDTSN